MPSSKIKLYGLKPYIDRLFEKGYDNESVTIKVNEYMRNKGIDDSVSSVLIGRYKRNMTSDVKHIELNEEQGSFMDFWEDAEIIISGIIPANCRASMRKLRRMVKNYNKGLVSTEDDNRISEKDKVIAYVTELSLHMPQECRKIIANSISNRVILDNDD